MRSRRSDDPIPDATSAQHRNHSFGSRLLVMLRTLVAAFCLTSLCAAADLKIVRVMLSDSEGGVANGESWEYTPGQIIYFTCRVSGFTPSPKHQVQLSYTVQAFDSRGAAVAEADKGSI